MHFKHSSIKLNYQTMNLKAHIDNDIFHLIGNVADAMNIDAYVVGGYVRDIILKRPSTDIDIVCIGSGIELAKQVAQTLPQKRKCQSLSPLAQQ